MGETKFTPGPWEVTCPVGKAAWIESDQNPNIAAVHHGLTDVGMANARLIAAAPDMYEALKACLDRLCDLPTTKEDTRLAGIIEAALRKAEEK